MTIGRSGIRSTNTRHDMAKARRRSDSRKILLESLEARQLMAVGPQLISIQPNEGGLINEGQILNVSPNEIIFRFDDSASIDSQSIVNGKGILISRSGGDGVFDRAYVSTDLGTNGAVVLDFAAAVPGQTGNGIQVSFTQVARTDSSRPILTLTSTGINIEVNTTFGLKTTAQDILTAFANTPTASARIITTRLRGNAGQIIADTVPVGQPLVLTGANTARASSNLNAGNNVQVEFLAAQVGPLGSQSRVVVTQRDFGGRASPIVTATSDNVGGVTFQTVNIQMNSNPQFMTTLGEFVGAINGSAAAASIVQTRIISGLPTTAIGAAVINYSPIVLQSTGDIYITPAYVGIGDTGREVVMRFAEPLPDDFYRIDILGRGSLALRNSSGQAYNGGTDTSVGFILDLGVRIESVVPQPITRNTNGTLSQAEDTIHVYLNNDTLNVADAENEGFYQLRYVNATANSQDDQIVYPRSAIYNAAAGRVELKFARSLSQYFNTAGGQGAFRLRIGSRLGSEGINFNVTVPSGPGVDSLKPLSLSTPIVVDAAQDPGSRFDNARDVRSDWIPSATTPSAVVLTSEIRNVTPYELDFPGADSEPGNRDLRYQQHVTRTDTDGIEIIEYNFQGFLGTVNNSVQLNAITEDQKQLARRVFSLYENYLGVRFIESASRGLTVGVGDIRVVANSGVNGPGAPFLATGALLANGQAATVIDIQDFNSADQNRFGSDLFRTLARGIGTLLGLGTADEIPGLTVQSNTPPTNPGIDTELVFPGDADLVYGMHAHRPEGKDIDLYRFSLPVDGKIKIEISAERLSDSSLLDAALRLYQRRGTGWVEIAGNDDYFSQDSFVALDLAAGDYIVGVSAKGNQTYDPNIEDSGLGGRSEGKYELRLDFQPPETALMREPRLAGQALGTPLDGDSDGRPGGLFDFWFVPNEANNSLYVDKAATTAGSGSIAAPYRTIASALAATNVAYPTIGNVTPGQLLRSQTGDSYRVIRNGSLSSVGTESQRIATDVANGLVVKVNVVVRIVGNGGADGKISTPADNQAYEIGFNRVGQAQADGTTFDVPKNVTVMIDAGAIIKLSRARIGVGSTTISVDRSGGALQVIGIPRFIDSNGNVISDLSGAPVPGSVYFTTINDTQYGVSTNRGANPPAAAPGDWGGIDLRNQIDSSLASAIRPNKEQQGMFLNSIVHSNVRFGGGQVIVDGVSQVITPIHMVDSRPTVANSLITRSADAAMAATPNSFRESNFQDPNSQLNARFISDFDRVGPDIHGNRTIANTVNGLFVKTRTGAASTTEVLAVPGRFDDLDIVHVISENLIVQGSAGGARATQDPPTASTVGLFPLPVASLDPNVSNGLAAGAYRYRFAFVDIANPLDPHIGPASAPTPSVLVSTSLGLNNGQVRLTALPALGLNQRLAVYRANVINGVDGEYRKIVELDASQVEYTDRISTLGTLLTTTPNAAVLSPSLTTTFTPSADARLTRALSAGTYAYALRSVAGDGSESDSTVATTSVVVATSTGIANGRVTIGNLPAAPANGSVRIYRAAVVGNVVGNYTLAGVVSGTTRSFVDENLPVQLALPVLPNTGLLPPNVVGTTFQPRAASGISALRSGAYQYRFAYASDSGLEGASSAVMSGPNVLSVTVTPAQGEIFISNLPPAAVGNTLRIYRATVPAFGAPVFSLVAIRPAGAVDFVDDGRSLSIAPAISPDLTAVKVEPRILIAQDTTPLTVPLSNALSTGTYEYRFSFVTANGESLALPSSQTPVGTRVVVTASTISARDGKVLINNLPVIPAGQSLRVYRATVVGGVPENFYLVSELAGTASSFLDTIATPGEILNDAVTGALTARTNGSLVVDPGVVMKFQSSRIEVQDGGHLYAEGTVGRPIVMTSIEDFTYGAGGTFNTPNRGVDAAGVPNRLPAPGNWGGLYIGQGSKGSLDYARVLYGGGTTRIDGGFASFNAIEVHQAEFRIANSTVENSDDGVEGTTTVDRIGRGTNFAAAVFVRGSQPIIIDNRISNNVGAAINIDVNSLKAEYVDDYGRNSGFIGRIGSRPDNQGPLIEGNRIGNRSGTTAINGMLVRGQTLTTESVWDDADIVHVVNDEIIAENLYTYGGLRLESKPTTSLVVKFGGGSASSTGLTASGRNLDIADRIGGSVQIVGQPSFPVILTALTDDTVGAGFSPNGLPNFDTDNDGSSGTTTALLPTGPEVDRGILIDNDVATNVVGHFEYQPEAGGGINFGGSGITAQGRTQQLVNANVIFGFTNYIDVGSDGGGINLAATTITLQPTLISPDLVASEGNFAGTGGEIVNWRVESRFDNGVATLFNTLSFTSTAALGNIRFINYLDEDVQNISDDILFTQGTPGQADFRAFTVDGAERFGFSQGGIYLPGAGLVNANYVGWTADVFSLLRTAITGPGTQYTVAGNIVTANLPPFVDPVLGAAFGPNDVTTAFAWDLDPLATSATVTTFLELQATEVRSRSTPGEWRGLLFETESNDRNVASVMEREQARSTAQAINDIPSRSQLLGTLSSSSNSGDENVRLGFNVQGTISRPSDSDVYSFFAVGGTEVWFDIDKTTNSLDTVVELIDADGKILALSDNSFDEEADPSTLYRSTLNANSVNPLRKTDLRVFPTDSRGRAKDLYSTNPRDAGLRVVLPGPTSQSTLYHVRIRSSNSVGETTAARLSRLTDPSQVDQGKSRGAYQVQIRLGEADEFPGSSVSYADIRYAVTGVDLAGVPRHSPLLGETAEVLVGGVESNDSFATAQNLGNLLATDRAALSLAGSLASSTDVDWYRFTIDYNVLTTQLNEYFSTIFDVDYADGIGRPDTSIYLYDANGNLINFGLSSNILDDRAGVLRGADNTDLGRGSSGTRDPFIGALELAAGEYFLAITSQGMIPAGLAAQSSPNAGDPLLRTQPSASTRWVVEDRVDAISGTTALPPISPSFLPVGSQVPFTLGDVALYVSSANGGGTNINILNPRTGNLTNTVGTAATPLRDIAFRFNGDLRGFNILPGIANANTDLDTLVDYWHVEDDTANATNIGESGIQTLRYDYLNATAANRQELTDANNGINFNAITFANLGTQQAGIGPEVGIAVGTRPLIDPAQEGIQTGRPLTARGTNTIYRFNPNTGEILGASTFNIANANGPDTILGNGTDVNERGYIETTDLNATQSIIVPEATTFTPATIPPTTTSILRNGDSFSVRSPGIPVFTFSYYSGPEFLSDLDPARGRFLTDGDRFIMDGQIFEIQIAGTSAPTGGARPVLYQATDTNVQFAQALQAAMNLSGAQFTNPAVIPVTVGQDGARINFSGATTIQALAGTITNTIALATPTSNRGLFSIPFLAQDTANDIAVKTANAINANAFGFTATVTGSTVTLSNPGIVTATTGSILQGSATSGGTITGIAVLNANSGNGRIFAVSDTGGFYEVSNQLLSATGSSGNVGTPVATAAGLTGIPFTGLTAGPRNVEGGRFANLLFATAANGRIYCLNTLGELQPVFAGGATSVATGIFGLNGLAFSTLDYNLWHVTGQRGADAGHGRIGTSDGVVAPQTVNGQPAGGQSWYFGFEDRFSQPNASFDTVTDPLAVARFNAGPVQDTYNFPGGALGVLESQPISLENVVAADSPNFYFTYFTETEDALGRDVLRVRAMGDNGVWTQVAVNDSIPSQNIFNSNAAQSTWRQAKINLAPFVGNKEVRFRFEFSTGGGLGAFRGPELRTIAAAAVKDGDSITLGGRTFELDFGTTFVTPAGASIPNNTTLQLSTASPAATYNFVFYDGTGNPPPVDVFTVRYDRNQTAIEVANSLAAAVNQAVLLTNASLTGTVVQAITVGNRLQLTGGTRISANALFPTDGSAPGVGAGRSTIPLTLNMTADQVAVAIQTVLNSELANNVVAFPVRGSFISLPGLTVLDDGPFTFTSSTGDANSRPAVVGNRVIDQRLTNNAFEGIYLDDFVIGFGERGESVRDINASTTFIANPNGQGGSINVGPYQLEIRGGEEYLSPNPVGSAPPAFYDTDGSFAVNDRLANGTTLLLSGSETYVHNDSILINDGQRSLRFVLRDRNAAIQAPLSSDEIAVFYSTANVDGITGVRSAESGTVIASRLRDVINSPAVQSRLNVTATSINGAVSGLGGAEIALPSNAVVTVSRPQIATVNVTKKRGDVNTTRDQGQIIIENSKISDSLNFGIRLRPDDRTATSNNANPGSVRNTVVLNNERLAPGASIINNELIGNIAGGIQIVGDVATDVPTAAVPFARIVNNTILGGTVSRQEDVDPAVFRNLLFVQGTIAFADRIPGGGFVPNFSGGPIPALGFNQPTDAIGIANFTGTDFVEPSAGQGAVSLGNGGRLVVEFTDNILAGSGNAFPDLAVIEVGVSEQVAVEVSPDGVTYTAVGRIDGFNRTIDLDAYGFNARSRLRFVRLTDVLNDGLNTGDNVGADIDAVGALSSVLATQYTASGIGIDVGANASPTLLNNILVNNTTGLSVDATSASTVIGGMIFQGNTSNLAGVATLGQATLTLPLATELFEDPFRRLFYPELQAASIDSSVDSLIDRAGLLSVKAPLGLQPSPILAPTSDLNGLLRVDDPGVDSPFGLGENVFKDRGAQDRSDFIGPTAVALRPLDNDTIPADIDPITGVISLQGEGLSYFDIRLFDGGDLGLSAEGTGVDPASVNSASVILTRDGRTLVEGVDYRFGFNSTSTVIRLTAIGGVWPSDSIYTVRFIEPGQSVIPLKSVKDSTDGSVYTIVDSNGNVSIFELDLGSILTIPISSTGLQTVGDGGLFTLTQNGRSVTFEFDNDGLLSTGAIPISILPSDSANAVILKMIAAIQNAGLNVSTSILPDSRIQIIGPGIVLSNLTANLQSAGANGVTSVAIAIPLDAALLPTAADVATAVANSIRNAGLIGVSATTIGSNVLVDGANGVIGFGTTIVKTITDRAGNQLRANQPDGSTVLTIQIGAGFDYGDAPDTPYASKKSSNGARHSILDGFQLGASVTSDPDARLSDADSDDGLVLNGAIVQGFASQFIVTASGVSPNGSGYLSAWVDFDGDGLFEEEERITSTSNDLLNNQSKPITFTVPGSAKTGTTYTRLRYSSTRALSPTGEAVDGEVEDHVITIGANPYKNQTNNADVNADGSVTPIDALQVINFLARNGASTQLTNPPNRSVPPFIDVNGDGFCTPIDVLIVINTINRQTFGSGEGEGSDVGSSWVPASSVASQATPPVEMVLAPKASSSPSYSMKVPAVENAWSSIAAEGELASAWLEDEELASISHESSGATSKSRSLHDDIFAEFEQGGLD